MPSNNDELVVNPHQMVAEAATREEQEDVALLLDDVLDDENLPPELEREIRAALSDLARLLS